MDTFSTATREVVEEHLGDDVEEFRQKDLLLCRENFSVGTDAGLRKNFGPDTKGEHEALHMAYVANSIIEDYVVKHPAVALNRHAYELATLASWLLGELHQAIAKASEPAITPKKKPAKKTKHN